MVLLNNLGPDLAGKPVNETLYRGMIRSMMYLTASRLDIQFSTCLYIRYQSNRKESHLIAVKRILRYLKGTPSVETRTYEEYELNNPETKDLKEPWWDNGVPYQLCDHICKPYRFKNEITKRPTCSSNVDGFCNGGELHGIVRVRNMTYFQDHKLYDELVDGKLNDETLAFKAKVEGSWGNATPVNDATLEPSVCKIRSFEMMKYSFNVDDEYISIKDSEYLNHSKDSLDSYQELLHIINEGWVMTKTNEEHSEALVNTLLLKNSSWKIITSNISGEFLSAGSKPRWENDPGKLGTAPDLIKRHSKQRIENLNLEEHSHPVVTIADQRTMAELLRAPTEGYTEAIMVPLSLAEQFELKYSLIHMMTTDQFFRLEKDNPHDHIRWGIPPDRYKDLLRACPRHGFTELHQLDIFYNALNPADQDSLNAAAGGNLLERKIAKLTHPVNQQTSVVTTAMTAMLIQFQATSPPAPVKAVEETCVTCEGSHPYYQCLAADGNTFPELRDNIQGYISATAVNYNQVLRYDGDECDKGRMPTKIELTLEQSQQGVSNDILKPGQHIIQGYVSAAVVNYNQGNPGYRPPSMANQIRPPGFAQPNVQNNQNRFGLPQGFNHGNNFNNEQSYQAPAPQNQNVHLNELEKVKRMNEANMKAMQTQIDMVKNELINEMKCSIQTSLSNQTNEIKNMMASLLQIVIYP
nr:uncharacterized mitochondrial protein AtMg00810-like [Tanacetum cinerariifolium]